MPLRKRRSLKWYFSLYQFVAHHRIKQNDVDQRNIHTHLVVTLTTGILMWGYAFLAWITIISPVPGYIGFAASFIHLTSPLWFRVTNKVSVPVNTLLAAGLVHQGTFAFFTGGFNSNIMIWYGILPMLGGVCNGKKGAITWTIMTVLVSAFYFALYISGFEFPFQISHTGFMWSQGFLVFGWIFLSSSIVTVYAGLYEYSERLLKEQSQKVDDLFRVLFHDLANPLGRITIGLAIAKRQMKEGEENRGLTIAESAANSMTEITQNIRKMYAVRKGKANMDLTLTSLNSTVEYVLKIYSREIENKKLKVEYDFQRNKNVLLLVEPISFKNQVLGNLLSNAIKFSPEGSSIEINAIPQNHGFIVEVRDHGIGIPNNLINHLFDVNKKTSRSGTQGEQGSGFGMNIMKSFVEIYDGSVEIESREASEGVEHGTIVRLKLKGEFKEGDPN
ncbi:MAG: sensor histidine kinase [Bacteriovoracia bacterium]